MNNTIILILGFSTCVVGFLFLGTFMNLFSANDNESLHKKRLKQLQFTQKRTSSDEESTKEFLAKFTSPVATHIIPRLNLKTNISQLEKDLEISQWNKFFTPTTFIAMDITLKIIGVIAICLLLPFSKVFAVVWGIAFCLLFKFLFTNSKNERAFRLLCEFPEFIRITQGFLMSNMPLSEAIENSLPYVGDQWRPILREFVVNSEIYSQEECIDILSSRVDIFEVKELWSLIRLNSEQGIDIKECFSNQADKVKALQLHVMLDKIGKRQIMSIAIQGPLLLTMIVGFGLPTLYQMMHLGF